MTRSGFQAVIVGVLVARDRADPHELVIRSIEQYPEVVFWLFAVVSMVAIFAVAALVEYRSFEVRRSEVLTSMPRIPPGFLPLRWTRQQDLFVEQILRVHHADAKGVSVERLFDGVEWICPPYLLSIPTSVLAWLEEAWGSDRATWHGRLMLYRVYPAPRAGGRCVRLMVKPENGATDSIDYELPAVGDCGHENKNHQS